MKNNLIFIVISLVLFKLSNAEAKGAANGLFRGDLALSVGYDLTSFKKTEGGYEYDHSSTSSGIGFMGRFGLRASIFSFGIVGELESYEHKGYKSRSNQQSVQYSFDEVRNLIGGFTSMNIGTSYNIELIGEYYTSVKSTIKISDGLSQNPYKANDTLSGTGWGLGIGRSLPNDIYGWALIRKTNYNSANLDGVATDLPSSTQTARDQLSITIFGGKTFF